MLRGAVAIDFTAMKRIILWILAILLFLLGAAALSAAGWLFAMFGTSGSLHTNVGTIVCPDGRAIVLDLAGISTTIPEVARLGTTTLDIHSSKEVFVGASERTNVDPILVGQSYCVANRSGADWGVVAIPGPDEVPFPGALWRTAQTGTDVQVPIGAADPITVLVVNSDGTRGSDAELAVSFTSPKIQPTAIGAAIAGSVLILVAIALIIWALMIGRRKRAQTKPGKHEAPASE